MEFKGSLGNYKIVETEDGSQTVYSSVYDENCHSTSGAWQETIHNYVQGCQVLEKLIKQDKVTIFEVGFGVAMGIFATLEVIKEKHPKDYQALFQKLEFISTEIDRDFALWALKDSEFARRYQLRPEDINQSENEIQIFVEGVNLRILIGDARQTISTLQEETLLDCIFQDPFSPKKNPTLWTREWFRNLRSLCHRESILSTYSAAVHIRKAMALSGFTVLNRKGYGRKRSCTLALCHDDLSQEQLELHNSLLHSKAAAFSDADCVLP